MFLQFDKKIVFFNIIHAESETIFQQFHCLF